MSKVGETDSNEQPKLRISLLHVWSVLLIGLVVCVVSLVVSQARARGKVETLISGHRLALIDWHFLLYRIDTQQFAPSWVFLLESLDEMGNPPPAIQVSLGGEVIACSCPELGLTLGGAKSK